MADSDVSIVGEYYRSRNGSVIHLAPCPQMGKAVRWSYADGRSLHSVVVEVAAADWLRLCKRCWPAAALNAPTAHPASGNRARIGAWADFVYSRRGGVTHVLPHLEAGLAAPRMSSPVLCGRTPALFEEWHGTGNQPEHDQARRMPLCLRCELASRGRTR
jgi:hypothetical protein